MHVDGCVAVSVKPVWDFVSFWQFRQLMESLPKQFPLVSLFASFKLNWLTTSVFAIKYDYLENWCSDILVGLNKLRFVGGSGWHIV